MYPLFIDIGRSQAEKSLSKQLDFYITILYSSVTLNKIDTSLQKLVLGNQFCGKNSFKKWPYLSQNFVDDLQIGTCTVFSLALLLGSFIIKCTLVICLCYSGCSMLSVHNIQPKYFHFTQRTLP